MKKGKAKGVSRRAFVLFGLAGALGFALWVARKRASVIPTPAENVGNAAAPRFEPTIANATPPPGDPPEGMV